MNANNGTSHADEAMHQIEEKIAAYGWAVVSVGGGDGDNQFAYTVGLAEKHGVELVVVGLDPNRAHGVLDAARRALASPDPLVRLAGVDQVTSEDVLEFTGALPMPVRFDRIPDRDTVPVNVAHKLEPAEDWALWQIVWPDADGHLPDHPDYDPYLRRAQVLPVR